MPTTSHHSHMTSWRPFLLHADRFPPADGLTVTHTLHTHTHVILEKRGRNGHSCALWTRHSATGLLCWAAGRRLNTRQWPTSFISPVDAKFHASAGWRCPISSAMDAQMFNIWPKQVTLTVKRPVKCRVRVKPFVCLS